MNRTKRFNFFFFLIIPVYANSLAGENSQSITLVYRAEEFKSIAFGYQEFSASLSAKGTHIETSGEIPDKPAGPIVIIGTITNPIIKSIANKMEVALPDEAEALLVKKVRYKKKDALIVTGFDERGTMYALLELAKQVEAISPETNVFQALKEARESPFASERSLSTIVYTKHILEGYWHDKVYWDAIFQQLAYSRINYYDIIFKVRPPIYTLFFDVEGYNREKVGGTLISKEQQEKNLESLRYIVQSAHNHGVNITIGIWNHVYNPEDADRLAPYTEAAISKLIKLVPFDAFQFRMHWESGLPRDPETLRRFWGSVFDGVNNAGRHMRIYPRAKGLPNLVIEVAVEKEMDFAIETKYTAEQMGMPYHPAHIQVQNQFDRRHGYADLLTHPKRYDILWRSWSWGSQKLLTWGSIDYTKRWVESTSLYNGKGIFEIMEIEGAKPMDDGSIRCLNDEYVYTNYEFQRYWYHNLLYGRLGYNPGSSENIFLREFISRFGTEAGPIVMQAMEVAGMILPRITGSAMPDFQEARGVPEWGSGSGLRGKALLKEYADVKPSDIQTFIGFKEASQMMVDGIESARIWPQQTAIWHETTSKEIFELTAKAEKAIGDKRNKEFEAVMTDLHILAGMSKFHSIRIQAALAYNLYELLDSSRVALNMAIDFDEKALAAYKEVVEMAGDIYRTDLDISVSDAGHWKGELVLLENALKELKSLPTISDKPVPDLKINSKGENIPPQVIHKPVQLVEPGKDLTINASVTGDSGIKWARILYRGVTQFQDYEIIEMKKVGHAYTATIPAEMVNNVVEYNDETGAIWDFMYLIEVMDNNGNGCIYPSIDDSAPYIIADVPHKTIEETKGKITYSKIKDKTYASQFHDRPRFEIISPVNNDVFMDGSEITVQMRHTWVDPDEVISLYINGEAVEAEKTGDLRYVIKDLDNGLYKINAHLVKVGLNVWSNSVEIVVGTTRK